jgi:cytochrome c-type biogenesis protein CcmH/NrfG
VVRPRLPPRRCTARCRVGLYLILALEVTGRLHGTKLSFDQHTQPNALQQRAFELLELERLLVQHPLRERLYGQLMLALYRAGRIADALGAYQHARRVLVDDLGLEPGRPLK